MNNVSHARRPHRPVQILVAAMALAFTDAPATAAEPLQRTLTAGHGAQLSVPQSWEVSQHDGKLQFRLPQGNATVSYIEVSADKAEDALQAAWQRFRPESTARPEQLQQLAPANGWRQRVHASFRHAESDQGIAEAVANQADGYWAVLLHSGDAAIFERYQAQLAVIDNSLMAPGYQRESLAGRRPRRLDAARAHQMVAFMRKAMRELDIPGGALALLEHGQIVLETGIGVRELGKPERVDAHTLFMNASTTKPMTTMMMARLVDQRTLKWDQRVTELYPAFQLGDSAATAQLQVQHLVCACTGLPRSDLELLFDFRRVDAQQLLRRIGGIAPTSPFGAVYQYNNQLAAAAGYIAAHAALPELELGQAYQRVMQENLFDPLHMADTTFDMERAQRRPHAAPHGIGPQGQTALASLALNYSAVPIGPAGGAWTSIHDLARFLQLEANTGRLPNGSVLVQPGNVLARRQPQVITGWDSTYGMGLGIHRRLGITTLTHSGSYFGYNSTMLLLPDSGIGLVAMSNAEQGMGLLGILSRRLLELTYGAKPEAEANLNKLIAAVKQERLERLHLTEIVDHGLESALAPEYRHPKLGTLTVRHSGDYTLFDFADWQTRVVGRRDDDGSVYFTPVDPTADFIEFRLGSSADRSTLVVEVGQEHYEFIAAEPAGLGLAPAVLPLEQEVEMALNAGPVHLRAAATVYAFGAHGYTVVRTGSNGFHCLVNRDGNQLGDNDLKPTCFDPQGSATILPVMLRVGELLAQRRTADDIKQDIDAGFRSGRFHSPQKAGIAYMLRGDVRYDPDTQTAGATQFPPHYMLYAPGLSEADIGIQSGIKNPDFALPSVYNGYSGQPHTTYIIIPAAPGHAGHH